MRAMDATTEAGPKVDGRQVRGDLTRAAVLQKAVDVASVVGLDGLSIGQLATELSISKSGLFAHFGAKEELQLATIRAARRIYAHAVVLPALEMPPGLGRLWSLSQRWIDYSRSRVFPGGCFFSKAAHDYGARTGAVHDAVVATNREWLGLLAEAVAAAQAAGELVAEVDPTQLAFELGAVLDGANLGSLLDDETVYDRADLSIRERLRSVAAPGVALPWDD